MIKIRDLSPKHLEFERGFSGFGNFRRKRFTNPESRLRATVLTEEPIETDQITQILRSYANDDTAAQSELFSILYDDLKKIAIGQMKREQAGHTLQSTALVHETFLKLVTLQSCQWENRYHFFVTASEVMRRILIDHFRTRQRIKRGGNHRKVSSALLEQTLDLNLADSQAEVDEQMLELNRALEDLGTLAPQKAEVVKLRFFARLTHEQIAETLGISRATVERYWAFSKAWLYRQIIQEGE